MSGTREMVSRSKRQPPSVPRASVTCHSVSRPRIKRVSLPGIGDRQQVDTQPSQDRLQLGGQPQPDSGLVLGRHRAEVEAAEQDICLIGVELQLVHRLQEGAKHLAWRAEPLGYARRRGTSLPCRRPARRRRSRDRSWHSAGPAALRDGLRPARRGCASVPRENNHASCPSGRRTRSSMIRPRWFECQT